MSIFSKISKQDYYDGESGKNELRRAYVENEMPEKARIREADSLVNEIIDYCNSNEDDKEICLIEAELLEFSGIFIEKINAAVKEGDVKEKQLEELTERMVFESDDPYAVKVGLILSQKYLSVAKVRKAVVAFSRKGEYIFYLSGTIKRLSGYNKFLINLAKASSGTIKVFAVFNLEYFSEENVKYLMEEGYKDAQYEILLINYILISVNLDKYLRSIEDSSDSINNMCYLVYRHLRNFEFTKTPIKNFLIKRFVPVIHEKGSGLYALLTILLIGQCISEETGMAVHEGVCRRIVEPLEQDRWKNIFIDCVKNGGAESIDVLEMAIFYNYKLDESELARLYESNNLDFYLYWYVNNKEGYQIRVDYMKKFLALINIDALLDRGGQKRDDKYNSGIEDAIFGIILNGCSRIYPEGKELALKGIFARVQEVRKEAVNALKFNRNSLTKEECRIISDAASKESSFELKAAMNRLAYTYENETREEYIGEADMKRIALQRHAKDIYLISTYVAGHKYRNLNTIEEEYDKSNVFYLLCEPENPYDKNAVRIVSAGGYVIGYIPRKDNEILHNMLVKNLHLYCVVREYSIEEDRIPIDVYFSYKSVLEEAGQLFRVITSRDNGYYEN